MRFPVIKYSHVLLKFGIKILDFVPNAIKAKKANFILIHILISKFK